MELSLDRLPTGAWGVITRIQVNACLEQRLKDYALVTGTRVLCSYKGPGDKVTALEFRGGVVAMRTRDLKNIWVHC